MEHFIYVLTDQKGLPFYVGKTRNPSKREKRHLYDAKCQRLNLPIQNKIRKLVREQADFKLEIVERHLSETEVDEREQFWITEYRRNGFKLYNVAAGGEGGKGLTPETIEKIRQAHLGKSLSEETKRKISEAHKGRKFNDAHKERLSAARKLRVTTEETRRRMRETSSGTINIKTYVLTDPKGNEHTTTRGLADFCRDHGLTPANLHKVLNGERDYHKGWSIRREHHQLDPR